MVSVLSYVGGVVLMVVALGANDPVSVVVALAVENLAFVAVATLAVLILRRQPRNRVAWGIMLAGVSFPLEEFFSLFTEFAVMTWGPVGLALFAGWVARWIWIPGNLAVPIILLYYPNGRLVSPRWRYAVYCMWTLAVAAFVLSAFDPSPMAEFGDLQNPLAVEAIASVPFAISVVVFFGLFLLPTLLGAMSLIPRYRRSEGVERQQMKVIAWVGAVAIIFFFLPETILAVDPIADSILTTLFTVFVGGALTAGIVRYRVFEIDRIISRTVSYAIIVALLGLVFAAGVVWLPSALRLQDSPVLVAGTTLLIAALFNPLRRRVQQTVEHRFNRSIVQAREVAERFAAQLQTANDIDEIADLWLYTVTESLSPEAAGLWLSNAGASNDPPAR